MPQSGCRRLPGPKIAGLCGCDSSATDRNRRITCLAERTPAGRQRIGSSAAGRRIGNDQNALATHTARWIVGAAPRAATAAAIGAAAAATGARIVTATAATAAAAAGPMRGIPNRIGRTRASSRLCRCAIGPAATTPAAR